MDDRFVMDLSDPSLEDDLDPPAAPVWWWDEAFPKHTCLPRPGVPAGRRAMTHFPALLNWVLKIRDYESEPDETIRAVLHETVLDIVRHAVSVLDSPERFWVAHESLVEGHDAALDNALADPLSQPEAFGAAAAEEWIKRRAFHQEWAARMARPGEEVDIRKIVAGMGAIRVPRLAAAQRYIDGTPFGPRSQAAFRRRYPEVISDVLDRIDQGGIDP